jgi:GT2 family glycosyltransferase
VQVPGVFAIVVTFKRPRLLKECIAALLEQRTAGLSGIYVAVNSNDQETMDVIHSFAGMGIPISFDIFDNVGPAGGFHHGLNSFLRGQWSHAWLLDDDVVVESDCLSELMVHARDYDYIYPTVVKDGGENVVSFGWWGVLLSRVVVEKAGLPDKDLFYWAEDTEYLQNRIMRVHGFQPFRSPTARVKHLHQRGRKRPSWYYYYTSRNTIYYRCYQAGFTWYRFRRTLILYPYLLFEILTKEDRKMLKLYLVMRGFCHGLARKTGKVIDPEEYK